MVDWMSNSYQYILECGDSPMVCDDKCEHGYLPDSRGCPYCLHCNPDPYPGEANFIFYFEYRRLINGTCVLPHH